MITIYTDGSSRGNPGPGGWAAIISYEKTLDSKQEDWVTELGGREDHTTNNRMEIMGAIKALEFATQLSTGNCLLFTDSEYVMKGITLWIHGWMQKGWKTAAKKPVLNQDLWQELWNIKEKVEKNLPAGRQVEWKYVAGHSGHALNERCDEIATTFADKLDPNLYEGPRHSYRHK